MPEIRVKLPTLHDGQVAAYDQRTRFYAVRCGRRWGKSVMAETIAGDAAIKSELVGYFAPDYKRITEVMSEIGEILQPVRKFPSGSQGVIRTLTGGRIDFWTLEDENAGRSRKYHKVIIDEAAFAKPNMMEIWERAIRPTLLDYRGSCMVLSNTNGDNPEQFFWLICNQPQYGFTSYHAPSHQNPMLPREDLDAWKQSMHPLAYQQEILAEFVDWSGVAFFEQDKLLFNDKPVACPRAIDSVFAVIDTGMKTGKENDGTGVVYFGYDRQREPNLYILDWDLVQIEGALLDQWLPEVFKQLEGFAEQYKARSGSIGAFIEDANSGTILLQQAVRRNWNARAIASKLTAAGKDGRALSVSTYVHRGLVKITGPAFDKVTAFKGVSRNHLLSQVLGFRMADKDAGKRADDLLDCFAYGIAISLGNSQGY